MPSSFVNLTLPYVKPIRSLGGFRVQLGSSRLDGIRDNPGASMGLDPALLKLTFIQYKMYSQAYWMGRGASGMGCGVSFHWNRIPHTLIEKRPPKDRKSTRVSIIELSCNQKHNSGVPWPRRSVAANIQVSVCFPFFWLTEWGRERHRLWRFFRHFVLSLGV